MITRGAIMITRGISVKLVDALMVTHRSCFMSLSGEDVQVIRDLYPATLSVEMMVKGVFERTSSPTEQGASPPVLS